MRIVVPAAAAAAAVAVAAVGRVQVRPVVDGCDILAGPSVGWSGEDPWGVLGPGGTAAVDEHPHEVRLARTSCTETRCGALHVTVRREEDEAVRDG